MKKENQISRKKIINTKLIKFFIKRLKFKRKRYKKYNYFKFSIIKYMRYINNINIYKLNNFLINYKFNLYLNEIVYNIENQNSNPIFIYLQNTNKILPTNIKKIKKKKKYKFKKRRWKLRWFSKTKRKLLVIRFKKIKSRFHMSTSIRIIRKFHSFLYRKRRRKKKALRKTKYIIKKKKLVIKKKKRSITRKHLVVKKYIPIVKKKFLKFKKIKKHRLYNFFIKNKQLTKYNCKKNFTFFVQNKQLVTNFKIFFNCYNFKTYQWRIII